MRRPLTHQLTLGSRELHVHLLDGHIEEAIRAAISRTPAGSFLTLAPAAGRDIVSAVQRALRGGDVPDEPRVILTQPDIRRFVKKLIELDLPDVRVVSYAELLPEVSIKPVSRATLVGQ
jgi:type III secretion protein V